jgi:hypothetical protein
VILDPTETCAPADIAGKGTAFQLSFWVVRRTPLARRFDGPLKQVRRCQHGPPPGDRNFDYLPYVALDGLGKAVNRKFISTPPRIQKGWRAASYCA